jgi:hypothetical protein
MLVLSGHTSGDTRWVTHGRGLRLTNFGSVENNPDACSTCHPGRKTVSIWVVDNVLDVFNHIYPGIQDESSLLAKPCSLAWQSLK